jgi:protein-tyrosine phosphatase
MGTTVTDTPIDASNIVRRLWVGSQPPFDRHIPGFDVLVLCAEELQPERLGFQGTVIRCPIPDAELSADETRRAVATGRAVASQLTQGKTVLVTCAAGLNRSALVAGVAIGMVTKFDSDRIIKLVRARRSTDCLFNPHFRQILMRCFGQR